MTFVRGAFIMAIGVLFAGFIAGRSVVGPLFASGAPPPGPSIAQLATDLPTKTTRPETTATTGTATATPTPLAAGTLTPTPSATPLSTGTPTPTPTPAPSPTAGAGAVTLTNYWVGSTSARRGSLLQIGYVLNNPTGKTIRVMLGASIKPSRTLNWATAGISDPARDVIATVTPGVSTHYRYFALSSGLAPGAYDVAWGLRNPSSGVREAITFAPDALRIGR